MSLRNTAEAGQANQESPRLEYLGRYEQELLSSYSQIIDAERPNLICLKQQVATTRPRQGQRVLRMRNAVQQSSTDQISLVAAEEFGPPSVFGEERAFMSLRPSEMLGKKLTVPFNVARATFHSRCVRKWKAASH